MPDRKKATLPNRTEYTDALFGTYWAGIALAS